MKKTAPKSVTKSRTTSNVSPILIAAAALLGGAVLMAVIVMRTQSRQPVTPSEVEAKVVRTVECSDDLRIKFDRDIRTNKRFSLGGTNAGLIATQDGVLNIPTGSFVAFNPWIDGDFTYQTRFLGFDRSDSNLSVADFELKIYNKLGLRVTLQESDDNLNSLMVYEQIQKAGGGYDWKEVARQKFGNDLKLRIMRKGNKIFVMSKPLNASAAATMQEIYKVEHPRFGGTLATLSVSNRQNAVTDPVKNIRIENFRLFCPGELPVDWTRDVE